MSLLRFPHIGTGLALFGACLCVTSSPSQTSTWALPGSGFVHDSATKTIRPISGFVGAATLGASVLGGVDWASVAPNQKSAIVESGRSLLWIPDLAAPAQSHSLGRIPAIQQAFWSADSTRAVVLARGSRLIWLNNFSSSSGNSPSTGANVRLADVAPSSAGLVPVWTLLAADNSADRVLLAVESNGAWQVWMASSNTAPSRVAFTGQPVAAVFASKTSAAYIADAAGHRIFRVTGLEGTPVADLFFASDSAVANPAGIVLSTDDSQLFVADRATGAIHVIDTASGAFLNDLSADAPSGSLTAVTNSRFLLNPSVRSVQPLLFLETANPARVLFVPRGN